MFKPIFHPIFQKTNSNLLISLSVHLVHLLFVKLFEFDCNFEVKNLYIKYTFKSDIIFYLLLQIEKKPSIFFFII